MALTESPGCDLVFYTHPMSRGRIVRWMLEETGADYRQVLLGYDTSMKENDYLAINPMGKVPAITHKGHVVTECAAICAYLADVFPGTGLAPALNERAAYYRWLFFAAGPLEAAVVNQTLNVSISEEQQRMVGYGHYDLVVDTLATGLSGTPYIAGDSFTAADVYVGAHVMWGMQFGSLPKRPEFEAYAALLADRPALKAAQAIDDQLAQTEE
ncbi:glutathione S-transferase family protein [Marinobacter nanhaiticus D15-8W]|uniref:Glutathione S-transferase family protein n=1 Tax=Marinobacter nanhaiticus D15-8W TaxID=626887 RepID=N6X3Z2_9GAMM|nr:glutathione S-transferase family protein [Marinobacter nanhaiticus]ENO15783.1 glutathione S-transferase family protein [Marinobacter nanhaiticus D15-8W]BES73359.1 glutathione S-transferase family protein [Marinobacter nanhaiticus D15-8W]